MNGFLLVSLHFINFNMRIILISSLSFRLNLLGLGQPIDVSSSSTGYTSNSQTKGAIPVSVPSVSVLTDHPLIPHLLSDIKFFSTGIVIEKCHTGMSISKIPLSI